VYHDTSLRSQDLVYHDTSLRFQDLVYHDTSLRFQKERALLIFLLLRSFVNKFL